MSTDHCLQLDFLRSATVILSFTDNQMLFIIICSKCFWLKQFYITNKKISTEGLMIMDVYRRNIFVLLWMSLTFIQEIYGKLAVVSYSFWKQFGGMSTKKQALILKSTDI